MLVARALNLPARRYLHHVVPRETAFDATIDLLLSTTSLIADQMSTQRAEICALFLVADPTLLFAGRSQEGTLLP